MKMYGFVELKPKTGVVIFSCHSFLVNILEQPLETTTGQLGSSLFSFIVSHYLNLSCLSQDSIEFTTDPMFFGFPVRNIFIGLLIFSRNIILA